MGLLDRIVAKFVHKKAQHNGMQLEAEGKLEEAYTAYVEAGQFEEASRVLLVRAQAEIDPEKRIGLLQLAASRSPGSAPSVKARTLAADLRLELLKASKTQPLTSELLDLAHELEALAQTNKAAEVYGLAGDTKNQTRMLVASGSIDALEEALESERLGLSRKHNQELAWKKIRDLDAIGQRLECLRQCEVWMSDHPLDENVPAFARSVRERMVGKGIIPLILQGQRTDLVVDQPVTIGRSGASLELPSPALSRQHLSISRTPTGVTITDLQSRNGTLLAGVRVDAPLTVGEGVDLQLGGQVPCRIEPWEYGGVRIVFAGTVVVAPLGPLRFGSFEVSVDSRSVVLLRSSGTAPILNGLLADSVIELAYGDQVREKREGPVVLEVVSR